MRYIGSKDKLLPFIDQTLSAYGITSGTFCDMFAGTTTVGRHFKRRGFRVVSNDLMQYSYVFGKAYLELNQYPQFDGLDIADNGGPQPKLFPSAEARLEHVLAYLNQLEGKRGFIYENYCDEGTHDKEHSRMYFSASNAARIDAIRQQIQDWQNAGRLTELEYYVLLAALLEAVPGVSNTSGTYAAFLKFWESRSQKTLTLMPPHLLQSTETHRVFQGDAAALASHLKCDVLYLDPPYNARQYAPNYHILETVACWDNPAIYGKSGMRPYGDKKSAYCRKETALQSLSDLAAHLLRQICIFEESRVFRREFLQGQDTAPFVAPFKSRPVKQICGVVKVHNGVMVDTKHGQIFQAIDF